MRSARSDHPRFGMVDHPNNRPERLIVGLIERPGGVGVHVTALNGKLEPYLSFGGLCLSIGKFTDEGRLIAALPPCFCEVRTDRSGRTPLMCATESLGRDSLEIVRQLVTDGADVNAKDDDGFTPLIDAAEAGNIQIVRLLLRHGADVHAKAAAGITALNSAREQDVLRLLADAAK